MKKTLAILGVCLPVLAQAHGTEVTGSGFSDGFIHAFSGLDHWLAMIAGGIWLSRMQWSKRFIALGAFAVLFSGAMLSANLMPAMSVDWGVIATAVVLTCLYMAFQRRYTLTAAIALASAVILFGLAHGVELQSQSLAMLGAVSAGGAALLLGSLMFGFLRRATLRVVRI